MTRKRRRILIALGAILLLIAVVPLGVRVVRLAMVPDVGEPFDVAAFRALNVPPEENALARYREAARELRPLDIPAEMDLEERDAIQESVRAAIKGDWQAADAATREWLVRNERALQLWREGTELPHAMGPEQDGGGFDAAFESIGPTRDFARLALLKAASLADAGDTAATREWCDAVLRSARHVATRSYLVTRLVAMALEANAAEAIAHWADRPEVQGDLLRRALDDVARHREAMPPPSETLKAEYLYVSTKSDEILQQTGVPKFLHDWIASAEVHRRMRSMLFANWLSQIDLPRGERSAVVAPDWWLFAPTAPALGGATPAGPDDVAFWTTVAPVYSRVLQLLGPSMRQFDDAIQREQATLALLETTLALQIHRREHGAFPENLDDVAGGPLESLPLDPFAEGEPLRYRRVDAAGSAALLWSLSPDGDDDAAEVEWDGKADGDLVVRLGDAAERP